MEASTFAGQFEATECQELIWWIFDAAAAIVSDVDAAAGTATHLRDVISLGNQTAATSDLADLARIIDGHTDPVIANLNDALALLRFSTHALTYTYDDAIIASLLRTMLGAAQRVPGLREPLWNQIADLAGVREDLRDLWAQFADDWEGTADSLTLSCAALRQVP